MRIGIFPNLMKESSISLVRSIVSLCKENGCEYYVLYDEEESDHAVYTGIEKEHLLPDEKIYDRIEVAFVLGGDGTILKSARHFASRGIPVCGINLGSLGFLYEVEAADLSARFADILAGRYFKEERIMLAGELEYADGMIQRLPDALNDVVIGHGNVGKLVRVDMSINGY
ncbi:MAG: NAD(+)/NADH kinase, partial [Megasphaera micronuciformis]|nr:NAD(+)/NADH kinase [Megasphaera micronuciformis]